MYSGGMLGSWLWCWSVTIGVGSIASWIGRLLCGGIEGGGIEGGGIEARGGGIDPGAA